MKVVWSGGDPPEFARHHEYVVIEIFVSPVTPPVLRILTSRDHTSAIADASNFTVVADDVPSNWTINVLREGQITLAPRAWARPGFWEDFYGSDDSTREAVQAANADFRREVEIIWRESVRNTEEQDPNG